MSAEPVLPDEASLALAAIEHLRPLIGRDQWHRYTLGKGKDKVVLPSVTGVIGVMDKPALPGWSARIQQEADMITAWQMAQRDEFYKYPDFTFFEADFRRLAGKEKEHAKALKEAGEIGTDLHGMIEVYCRRLLGETVADPVVKNDRAYFAYSGFEGWAKSVNLKPVSTEAMVYSKAHGYAGTFDLLAYVNGKLTIVDWKTGKSIYQEHRLQSVAYRMALAEMSGIMTDGLLVLLPKSGDQGIEAHPVMDDVTETFNVFKSLIPVYNWIKANEKARRSKK